jgi:glycosyltransferase involved in cell wall biosynthesis
VKVSVVIPALNEAADIEGCLEAVAWQQTSHALEVIVVDGRSDDGTPAVVADASQRLGLPVTVIDNPHRRTSTSLNVGLAHATGDILVRLDARSRVEPHYVATCIEVLGARPDVGVVGGSQVARPRGDRLFDRALARTLRNGFVMGGSRYRTGRTSGPADTVWMGAFRTGELQALGGWADDVALNEDFDLNERYRATGATVWFDARLRSGYLPRRTLGGLGRQYFHFGRVKGTWWARGRRPAPRQVALLAAPPVGVAVVTAAARTGGGLAAAGVVAAAALLVDTLGAPRADRDPLAVRSAATVTSALVAASWWTGVVVGVVGERVGVRHRHG